MPLIHVDGLSGTGKTTLSHELSRRGHRAVDGDAAFAYSADPITGAPTDDARRSNWRWDADRLLAFAESIGDETVFVCGGATNADDFSHVFNAHVTLVVDDDTLRHRILTRTNNDFGKDPEELATQLAANRTATQDAVARGSTVIDATQPLTAVADEILHRTLAAAATHPPAVPWPPAVYQRAVAYLTNPEGRLLVFDHVHVPSAGTQVPAGGIHAGETPEAAVLRELEEESGISDAVLVRKLGESWSRSDPGNVPAGLEEQVHHAFHLHLDVATAVDEWEWEECSGGDVVEHLFRLRWVGLEDAAAQLWPAQAMWLHALSCSLRSAEVVPTAR